MTAMRFLAIIVVTFIAAISTAWSPALARDGGSHGGGNPTTTTQGNKSKPALVVEKPNDKGAPGVKTKPQFKLTPDKAEVFD